MTVAAGSSVAFSYPSGGSAHNVVFTAMQPAACTQSTGAAVPGAAVPPLPSVPTAAAWSGQCTFDAPGTYAFVCGLHGNSMSGSVTVPAAGGAPPPPGGSPPPPPGTAPPPPPPPPPPGVEQAASDLRLPAVQRGFSIRGSVQVHSAGSRLLARALARRRALTGSGSSARVEVGRRPRRSVGGERVAFSVAVSATAPRALRRNGRLAITLRLTVSAPSGTRYSATRSVVLRAP